MGTWAKGAQQYKYWHTFECGHTQRTNNYSTWEWMKRQSLCKSCNEESNMTDTPPVGLRPASVWKVEAYRLRGVEISQAIQRYAESGAAIPEAWLIELAIINKKTQQA